MCHRKDGTLHPRHGHEKAVADVEAYAIVHVFRYFNMHVFRYFR